MTPKIRPVLSRDEVTGDVTVTPRSKLLERLPARAGRTAAFDEIHWRLAVATELFQENGDGGRAGVFKAVSDVIEYFSSRGIPHAALRPLEAVIAAIVDAEHGAENPVFTPIRDETGGRPPKPFFQIEFEGKLAIVMECCVRHCRAQKMRPYIKPAADMAARLINASSWPGPVTAKQLTEIRERIQQSPSSSLDRITVDSSLSSPTARALPLAWAEMILSNEWVNPPPKLSA